MGNLIKAAFLLIYSFEIMAVVKNYDGVDIRSGNKTKLSLDRSVYVVAYFLNGQCPCSQSHFDHLNELQKKYAKISFVGFHSNKSMNLKKAMKAYANYSIDFPILLDKELKYANIFNALKTPHVFILNKTGEVVYHGGATNSRNPKKASKFYLKDALAEITDGKEITIKQTKTLGCYIQR